VTRVLLTPRVLNRTLLQRQQLLARATVGPLADPVAMTEHLVGLQAQEPLPPYLSLAARIEGFDPLAFSAALANRRVLRLLLMRGTIHTVTPADAHLLRPLVQPMLDKVTRSSGQSRPAAHIPRDSLAAAGREVLEDGPLGVKALGLALAERFPDAPPTALANTLREMVPLVQVPPRGLWQTSGGIVYAPLEAWAGPPPEPEAAPGLALSEVVRRYLRAFGPASPADVTTWSGIIGVRAVLDALGDELVTYRTDDGRALVDLAGLPLADADAPAPVRLLGRYDNLWLSHAGRDRVTHDDDRRRWMGANGGVSNTVFVDGTLRGLWSRTSSGAVDVELFGQVTAAQAGELDDEVARVEALLAVPAAGTVHA
jgi:hypothetical protein